MTLKNIVQTASLGILLLTYSAQAWDPADLKKKMDKADEAKAELLRTDPSMQRFFDSASGWVIIPTVGKGAVGIGGARGTGLLYEAGDPTHEVTLSQLTIGFQWGGQAYSEFIFFKDEGALNHFKRGNFELGAQASAVAVRTGASVDANYSNGVAIFTSVKGGLMYEASVGGQKFKVKALD